MASSSDHEPDSSMAHGRPPSKIGADDGVGRSCSLVRIAKSVVPPLLLTHKTLPFLWAANGSLVRVAAPSPNVVLLPFLVHATRPNKIAPRLRWKDPLQPSLRSRGNAPTRVGRTRRSCRTTSTSPSTSSAASTVNTQVSLFAATMLGVESGCCTGGLSSASEVAELELVASVGFVDITAPATRSNATTATVKRGQRTGVRRSREERSGEEEAEMLPSLDSPTSKSEPTTALLGSILRRHSGEGGIVTTGGEGSCFGSIVRWSGREGRQSVTSALSVPVRFQPNTAVITEHTGCTAGRER